MLKRLWRGCFSSRSKTLLAEVAALEPIQNDHNEEVIWWCAFCGEESGTPRVQHASDCLWVRISNHVSANVSLEPLARKETR